MITPIFLLAALQTTDWAPLKEVAGRYGICAASNTRSGIHTRIPAPALADSAIKLCIKEERELKDMTRRTVAPLAPSQAALDELVAEQAAKQRSLLRAQLIAFIEKLRR